MDFVHCTSILEKNNCVPRMEKFEWRMLDNGSCTIKGGKDKRLHNEVNQINMVKGITRSLDGEIIWNKILITTVAKKEIKTMKLSSPSNHNVATLALGSRPRQGLVKMQAKNEAQESHFMLPGVRESVREWTSTLPSELPLWESESLWTPKSPKRYYRGQTH
jgi:hypothetical protein